MGLTEREFIGKIFKYLFTRSIYIKESEVWYRFSIRDKWFI